VGRSVIAGDHKIVFLMRGPLYFVMAARTDESEEQMAHQLNYVHKQIVSILTQVIAAPPPPSPDLNRKASTPFSRASRVTT
jgi:hypothetical protein